MDLFMSCMDGSQECIQACAETNLKDGCVTRRQACKTGIDEYVP